MDNWAEARRRVNIDGESISAVARDMHLSWNCIKKWVTNDAPPTRKTYHRTSSLESFRVHIDGWLQASPRITAHRIGTLLRKFVDPQIRISERSLREFVAKRRTVMVPKEAFIRAEHAPGDTSQFDFSDVFAVIGGVLMKLHMFVLRLNYSTAFFARCGAREDQLALFTGMLEGFQYFGGLTRESVFDNPKTAVTKVLRGRNRQENQQFAAFHGALGLRIEFAAPRKGWEKGGVEGAHGFIKDNFFTPLPYFDSIADLNAKLRKFCDAHLDETHSVHKERIGDRLARELEFLRDLPEILPKAVMYRHAQISKFCDVIFETNRYSAPARYSQREALLEISEDQIRIILNEKCVAEHVRWYGKGEFRLNPQHFAELLAHKHRAGKTAVITKLLPQSFLHLRSVLFEHMPTDAAASRAWGSIVKLIATYSIPLVANCIDRVLARGSHDVAAIALLVKQTAHPAVRSALQDLSHDPDARMMEWDTDLALYNTHRLAERYTND